MDEVAACRRSMEVAMTITEARACLAEQLVVGSSRIMVADRLMA